MAQKVFVIAVCLSLLMGCEKRKDTKSAMFAGDDPDFVVAVLIDLSPSFQHLMSERGQGYEFLVALLDKYFRERLGNNDQLILAQISGESDQILIWQGSPFELRKQFPNPKAFSAFLASKATPNGSQVHESITQTVEYLMGEPGVANGKSRSALFVLSDLMDSGDESESSRAGALDALRKFGGAGGEFAFYFVDQQAIKAWKRELAEVGIDISITTDFRRPSLPSFE